MPFAGGGPGGFALVRVSIMTKSRTPSAWQPASALGAAWMLWMLL
jgi:hypothetical protein